MEDPITGVKQVLGNPMLALVCALTVCSILFFNLNGLILTKHVSCVFRSFWDATRTVSVWVNFSLFR